MAKIEAEAAQLREQLVNLSNATYAGRYIFSGYKTDKPLLNADGTFNIDISNSEQIKFEIGIGDDINVNVTGSDLFNSGLPAFAEKTVPPTPATKSSFVDTFDQVITAMDNGDQSALSNLIGNLDDQMNNLLRVRAGLGARMNRVELTANRLEDDNVNFTSLMSKNEDVDMAEAIMNLTNEENVYKASLSTGARVIQPSLVDFLK